MRLILISCKLFLHLHFITTSLNNTIAVNKMTMIYDPIPFINLVQKFLVGNYEHIMGICGKIFIINLHNLQMVSMLWIKYKFSECLAPLYKHEGPNGRISGDGSSQARRHEGHSGRLPPNLLCVLPNFVMLRKICFKHKIKTKIFTPNVFYHPKP